MTADRLGRLFVYGTLLPGDVRWGLLAPFVVDEGVDDHVPGALFDTGLDYPAATFQPDPEPSDRRAEPAAVVLGRTFALLDASLERALDVLDREEDLVLGLYRRVVVMTGRGIRAWAYAYGTGLELTPIPSGDWLAHRGLR